MKFVFAYDKETIKSTPECYFQYPSQHNNNSDSYPYEYLKQLNVSVPTNGWPAHNLMSQFLEQNIDGRISNNEFERSWLFGLFENTLLRNKKKYTLTTVEEALNNTTKFIYPLSIRLWRFPNNTNIPVSFLINNPFKVALQKVIPAINKGQCCLLIQATIWPVSPNKDKSKILVLQRMLRHAGIKSLQNVFLITATEGTVGNDESILIKTLFWEHFESSIILNNKENIDYKTKLSKCKTDTKFKRFLYLNHKERAHRVYMYYKLCTKVSDFHKKFAASFCPGRPLFSDSLDNSNKTTCNKFFNKFSREIKKIEDTDLPSWFTHPQTREQFCQNLLMTQNINKLSLTCDLATWDEKIWRTNLHQWTLFAKPWENSGIYIGTETTESYKDSISKKEYLTLTEKTFKPIAMKSPFIIYGQPFILKKLHEYGYKTFSSLWDESYDTKIDLVERVNSIINTIQYLNNLSDCDFYNLLKEAHEIVEHNYNHMMNNRYPEKHIYNELTNFMLG